MIRNYHNHKLQTNPWHREEEPHSNHEKPGRRTKQSNQLSLPRRDAIMRHQEDKQSKATSSLFPIIMIAKLEWT